MSQNIQKPKLIKTTRRTSKKSEKMYTLSELLNTIKILEKTIKEQKKVSSCTICMEEISNDKIVTTRCNHHFCQECILILHPDYLSPNNFQSLTLMKKSTQKEV